MMRNNNIEELLKTVERIRSEKYPDLPEELVKQIIKAEFDNMDSRSEASNCVKSIVSEYLQERRGE